MGWKKVFHANGNQKKTRTAILVSQKIDFKVSTVTRDKEGHYLMIQGSIQKEDKTIVNIDASNIGILKYIKQILIDIKGETDSNIVLVGTLKPHLHQWMDHPTKSIQKKTGLK